MSLNSITNTNILFVFQLQCNLPFYIKGYNFFVQTKYLQPVIKTNCRLAPIIDIKTSNVRKIKCHITRPVGYKRQGCLNIL